MAPIPIFRATVAAAGVLRFDRPVDVGYYLRGLAGQVVEVLIRRPRTTRSDQQNRYMWGVVVAMISDETGYTPEEAHEAMKWRFLRLEDPDHPYPTVRSTTSLSTGEMETYLAQIREFAATELGLDIPEPNEVAHPAEIS